MAKRSSSSATELAEVEASLGALSVEGGDGGGPPAGVDAVAPSQPPAEADDDLAPETAVAQWLTERLEREVALVRSRGAKALGVPIRNAGLVVEEVPVGPPPASRKVKRAAARKGGRPVAPRPLPVPATTGGSGSGAAPAAAAEPQTRTTTVHRVEASTTYDFDGVTQLMYSDSEPLPGNLKPGYRYLTLVAITAAPASPALLIPYVYEDRPGLEFTHWRLVNQSLKETTIALDGVGVVQ